MTRKWFTAFGVGAALLGLSSKQAEIEPATTVYETIEDGLSQSDSVEKYHEHFVRNQTGSPGFDNTKFGEYYETLIQDWLPPDDLSMTEFKAYYDSLIQNWAYLAGLDEREFDDYVEDAISANNVQVNVSEDNRQLNVNITCSLNTDEVHIEGLDIEAIFENAVGGVITALLMSGWDNRKKDDD